MSEMIEQVSRALFLQEFPTLAEYADDEWPGYVDIAQTAIEAMREPTGQMAEEGSYLIPGDIADPTAAKDVWREMIGAALK